jgi:excisionase family DNA binding protein
MDIDISDNRLWTIKEAAAYLGVSVKYIEKLRTARRFIPAIPLGRCIRWDPVDVRLWALNLKEKVAA